MKFGSALIGLVGLSTLSMPAGAAVVKAEGRKEDGGGLRSVREGEGFTKGGFEDHDVREGRGGDDYPSNEMVQRAYPGDGNGGLGRGQDGRILHHPLKKDGRIFTTSSITTQGKIHQGMCIPGYNDWGTLTGKSASDCFQFCMDTPDCVTADYTGGKCYPSKAGMDKAVPYDNCFMWVKELGTGLPTLTTLVAVKCIRPSDGMDPWVDDLIGWAISSAVTIAGALACGATAGAGCVALGVAASIGIGSATTLFVANGGPEQMDQFFDNGEDDLYVTMNGQNVFPGGDDDISTGSQKTHYPNKSHGGTPKICIWDWDWPSADDNLGCVETNTLDMGKNLVLLASEAEGSIYQMEILME